ncbi:hypothetical protein Tco_0392723 [Tanacetum coccineum]
MMMSVPVVEPNQHDDVPVVLSLSWKMKERGLVRKMSLRKEEDPQRQIRLWTGNARRHHAMVEKERKGQRLSVMFSTAQDLPTAVNEDKDHTTKVTKGRNGSIQSLNSYSTKLPILDTGKFEQWKFKIQQYLQHEHYALWEVIEFGDSYKASPEETAKDKATSGEASAKKMGRTVAITTEDMQKRRNDVKARATLLLALPDEHHHKKTKKNQLKQQYDNFKAEGSETLEQTFNMLQAIVSHLEFMDVPIEKDDLNHKFLTSLAPEWLMYTIV